MASDRCYTVKILTRKARVRFSSVFFGAKPVPLRGPGIEYLDFREYCEGDDIRFVDWRITARSINPLGDYRLIVKEFLAERMVNNTIILDYSGSMNYGDKLFSAIYVISGFLWLAYSLDDIVDLIILRGSETYIQSSVNPIQAIIMLQKHICELEPKERTSLRDVVNILDKLHKRRTVFLISDYGHRINELVMLGRNIYARNMALTLVNITTPIEYQPPTTKAFFYFKDYETEVGVKTDVKTFYKALEKHMLLYDTYSLKIANNVLKITSLDDAVMKTPKIIRVYIESRSRVKTYTII